MHFSSLPFAGLLATATAQSLTEAISSTPDLSQLGQLIAGQPDLAGQLASASNITILAPSNNAIGALLNSSTGRGLASNPAAIAAVLKYHVIQGTYLASAIPETEAFVPTLLSDPLYANVTGGQRVGVKRTGSSVSVFSGGLANSTVTQANLNFTGGVVHVIDSVLTLPANASTTAVAAGLSSLAGALTTANLVGTVDGLKDVTIFAPNNAAFQRIGSALANISTQDLTSVLTYHVVAGSAPLYSTSLRNGSTATTVQGGQLTVTFGSNGKIFVNNAEVITPNVLIAGGVVHVIDQVLNPAATAAASGSASSGTPAFSGASSVSSAPFTSGIPAPSSTLAGGAAASGTSRSSTAGGVPMMTGAVGAAALFGAGAAVLNF